MICHVAVHAHHADIAKALPNSLVPLTRFVNVKLVIDKMSSDWLYANEFIPGPERKWEKLRSRRSLLKVDIVANNKNLIHAYLTFKTYYGAMRTFRTF